MYAKRPQQQRQGYALALLFAQMAQVGFDKIPPVTLVTILGQVVIFLRIITLPNRIEVGDVCISALQVWYREDWLRLILGALQHADDWHLYYNMVSMLWKGRKIEGKIGSPRFALLLLLFTPLVSIFLILLITFSEIATHDSTYITQCHVGFSGVLFALKVVLNYLEPDTVHHVLGFIPVSATAICWVELVLIHFMVPNSSFLGHLAGILVGLWYIHGPFLKAIINMLTIRLTEASSQANRSFGQGQSGYRSYGDPRQPHQEHSPSSFQDDPETIRLRRLHRYNQ